MDEIGNKNAEKWNDDKVGSFSVNNWYSLPVTLFRQRVTNSAGYLLFDGAALLLKRIHQFQLARSNRWTFNFTHWWHFLRICNSNTACESDKMEDLPINEKIYMLQLQLKRNRETKEQKKIELEEILGSYESQIRTLIYQLYKTANLIWAQVNSKAALMNGALFAEKKEPEFQKSADYNNITRKLNMIRENPKVFRI